MHRPDRGRDLRILEDLLGPLLGFSERGPVHSPLAREPVNTQQVARAQTGRPLRSLGSRPVVHREHAVRCSSKALSDLGGTQHSDIRDHWRCRRIPVFPAAPATFNRDSRHEPATQEALAGL